MDDTMFQMVELSQKGYYCSQIIILLALESQGRRNPDLVRALAGLAYGAGIGSETCGALTGGACLLALYTGKGTDEEEENFLLLSMLKELGDWFTETYAGTYEGVSCDAIVGDGADRRERCGKIVAETYFKAIEILISNGIDPTEGR